MKALRVIAVVLAAAVFGCGGFDMKSGWRDRDIVIDGQAGDWQSVLSTFDEKGDVGFLNDDKHLYICFIPRDPQIENQMIVRGLTVWFDREGGDKKTLGVRFPLGLIESPDAMQGMSMMRRNRDPDRKKLLDEFQHTLTRFEVVTVDDSTRFALGESGGIEVAIGRPAKNVLGVGLETPEIDLEALRQQMRARGEGRPAAGRGGGRSSGMGGGRGGMRGRPGSAEPLDAWGKLFLADAESAI
ncbi:MAG: hypothetical protein JSW67_14850 [Candidatus Latescibacterota bacterium]|nr:MAG: hypothetical protein JSW67_14850 [Candidatus Latescibacterota bacterium]